MSYVKTTIDGMEVLIATNDELINVEEESFREDADNAITKMKELSGKAFSDAKLIIESIAKEYSNSLRNIDRQPDEMELEFNMSFSINNNLWVLGSESNVAFKVKYIWKNDGEA